MKRFSLTSDALNNTCWLNPERTQLTLPSWQFQRKTITYWVWERSYWVRYWGSKYYASHFWHLCLVFVFVFSENSVIKNWHSGKSKREKKSLVSELFTLHCSSEPKGFPCKIQMWPPDSVTARTTIHSGAGCLSHKITGFFFPKPQTYYAYTLFRKSKDSRSMRIQPFIQQIFTGCLQSSWGFRANRTDTVSALTD